jgi:histidinol dehydrogenase
MDPKNRAKLMINKLSSKDQNFTDHLNSLTSWDNSSNEEINSTVKTIIDDVIKNGDQSVLDYTQKFDSVDAESISELRYLKRET